MEAERVQVGNAAGRVLDTNYAYYFICVELVYNTLIRYLLSSKIHVGTPALGGYVGLGCAASATCAGSRRFEPRERALEVDVANFGGRAGIYLPSDHIIGTFLGQ